MLWYTGINIIISFQRYTKNTVKHRQHDKKKEES